MARQVVLIDDVDGTEAVETIRFGLDGANFEIDLGLNNAMKMRADLEPFREKARRKGGRHAVTRSASTGKVIASPPKAPTGTVRHVAPSREVVRAWAQANGFDVKPIGRLSKEIMAKYEQANPS